MANVRDQIYWLFMSGEDLFGAGLNYLHDTVTRNPGYWRLDFSIEFYRATASVTNIIRMIALQLVVVFFLIGFCSTAMDLREQLNFENILKLFIKIGITQYFVIQCTNLTWELYSLVIGIINSISVPLVAPGVAEISTAVYDMTDTSAMVFLFVAVFYLIICLGTTVMLMYMALSRMFKISFAEIYGPLAFSTIASGNRHISDILPTYIKYIMSLLFEGIGIAIMLKLHTMFFGNTTSLFDILADRETEPFFYCVTETISRCVLMILFVALCKVAMDVPKKALGLER